MTFISALNRVLHIGSADSNANTIAIEKVRWSMHQRLRKRMVRLSAEFFDEVDDILFARSEQGRFELDCIYFQSMREIRAKQGLFEETFLDSIMAILDSNLIGFESAVDETDGELPKNSEAAFEKVEIALAIQAMTRKAEKYYQPFLKKIDSLNSAIKSTPKSAGFKSRKIKTSTQNDFIKNDLLLRATLSAFTQAQDVLSLALKFRLIFIKLFEKHFLLKMEKMHMDIIHILNNVNNQEFVEKLYTSSSTPQSRLTSDCNSGDTLNANRSEIANYASRQTAAVEAAVSEFIESVCEPGALPLFAEKMIRTRWRAVLLLIGLNRSMSSRKWAEAKRTASLFAEALSSSTTLSEGARRSMRQQLQQGFCLIKMPEAQQLHFLQEFNQYFGPAISSSHRNLSIAGGKSSPTAEASVSPSGAAFLDHRDIKALTKLVSNEPKTRHVEFDKQIGDYFPAIDKLADGSSFEYLIDEKYQTVTMQRNVSNPRLFNVTDANLKTVATRSRQGLAISLREGELRILNSEPGQSNRL